MCVCLFFSAHVWCASIRAESVSTGSDFQFDSALDDRNIHIYVNFLFHFMFNAYRAV